MPRNPRKRAGGSNGQPSARAVTAPYSPQPNHRSITGNIIHNPQPISPNQLLASNMFAQLQPLNNQSPLSHLQALANLPKNPLNFSQSPPSFAQASTSKQNTLDSSQPHEKKLRVISSFTPEETKIFFEHVAALNRDPANRHASAVDKALKIMGFWMPDFEEIYKPIRFELNKMIDFPVTPEQQNILDECFSRYEEAFFTYLNCRDFSLDPINEAAKDKAFDEYHLLLKNIRRTNLPRPKTLTFEEENKLVFDKFMQIYPWMVQQGYNPLAMQMIANIIRQSIHQMQVKLVSQYYGLPIPHSPQPGAMPGLVQSFYPTPLDRMIKTEPSPCPGDPM